MNHQLTAYFLLFLFTLSTITMILPGNYFGYQQILAEELVERSTLEEEAELEHYSIESTIQIYLTSKNSNFLSCDQKGEGMGFGFHDCQFTLDHFSPPELSFS
ncbi:MAG: hypothetical protein LW630_00845 [Saprospiraceae bacterium]|nr:hypothetical protein [Saprospiraceae bacterium]